jgi:hypothetical protein
MRRRAAVASVVAFAAAAAVGCDSARSNAPPPSASAVAVDAATRVALDATDSGTGVAYPADLDTKRLAQHLGCSNGRHARACRIVHDFDGGSRFEGQLPPGGARWVGSAYRIARGGAERRSFVVVHAIGIPSANARTADLPFKLGLDPVPKDKRRHASKLLRALAHSERVPDSNRTYAFVKDYVSSNARLAMATDGLSVRLLAEDAVFVRQSKVRQRLVVIQLKADASGEPLQGADGTYAEVWPVTW